VRRDALEAAALRDQIAIDIRRVKEILGTR